MALAGCANAWPPKTFQCADGTTIVATYDPADDSVELDRGSEHHKLDRMLAAKRPRYADAEFEYRTNGLAALIIDRASGKRLECYVP
jgi:hypothetical protein